MTSHPPASPSPGSLRESRPPSRFRFVEWLDQRTGFRSLLHESLDEPIPGGARFAYVFGSGLILLFLSQVITGIFLVFYYVPSADHAHTTVAYITKVVSGGAFLRSLHAYGASGILIILLLHLSQTFLFGSYKGRRELLWMSGCAMWLLMIAMAFSGYLLPWDQKAYFATAVGTNIASEVPLVGNLLKQVMRGGSEMGTLTLSRFFVAHVFLIPGLIFLLVAAHVYLFRKAGAAGPVRAAPIDPGLPTENFYPRQVVMDMAFGALMIGALGVLAWYHTAELGPRANPADTAYVPRPEWYYLPIFQWLKYWSGPYVVVGILVIPSIVAGLILFLPFIDRRPERRPWKRPAAVILFGLTLAVWSVLGGLSYRDDRLDTGLAMQLEKQREETEQFMQAPFEPEESSASVATALVLLEDPAAARGKTVYEREFCNACHGDGGQGTPAGTALVGIGVSLDAETITAMLREPTPAMAGGGMSPLGVSDADMTDLVAYLRSLE